MSNGEELIGFTPIHSYYLDFFNKIKAGDEIKPQLSKFTDSFYFSPNTYTRKPYFENLIMSEEILKFSNDKVSSIQFISWLDSYGYGEFNKVDSVVLSELLNKDIEYYRKIDRGAQSFLFITTDTLFSATDFDIYLNLRYDDNSCSKYLSPLYRNYNEINHLDKDVLDNIKRDINIYKDSLQKYLDQLLQQKCKNEKINTYIDLIATDCKNNSQFIDLTYSFLCTNQKLELQKFVDKNLYRVFGDSSICNRYKENDFSCLYNKAYINDDLNCFHRLLRTLNLFNHMIEESNIENELFSQKNLHIIAFEGD